MRFDGLTINLTALDRIIEGQSRIIESGGTGRGTGAHVSAEVLAETLPRDPGCRCDEMGLREGMPVAELILLGSGCTGEDPFGRLGPRKRNRRSGGWVCNRLDTVRRRYHK